MFKDVGGDANPILGRSRVHASSIRSTPGSSRMWLCRSHQKAHAVARGARVATACSKLHSPIVGIPYRLLAAFGCRLRLRCGSGWRRSSENGAGCRSPSWLIDGTLAVPHDAATEIGHAAGGRSGLDQ
jgi:hypothetical protein